MKGLVLAARVYGSPIVRLIPWLVIGLGTGLRIIQYLYDRSLWLDEAKLALNIVQRPMAGLFLPLDNDQGAPVGFLVVEKLAIQTLGNNEYVLRLLPLLSGIVSLFLFYLVLRQLTNSRWALVSLGLFAILDTLVYYASEVKQYSSDIAITLLLYFVILNAERARWELKWLIGVALTEALSIWFSHPAVFVIAGISAALMFHHTLERQYDLGKRVAAACVLPLISFGLAYSSSFAVLSANQSLLTDWSSSFAPIVPLSLSDLWWYPRTFFQIFSDPLGLALPGLGALALLVGGAALFRRDKRQALVLFGPIAAAFAASALHKYPFSGRLLLYLVPIFLVLIGEGARELSGKTQGMSRVVGIAFVALIFFHPAVSAAKHIIRPQTAEEIRPVLDYVKSHGQSQDEVYLYYSAQYAFNYYLPLFNFDKYTIGVGARGQPIKYIEDLDTLRGMPRVWVVFAHNYDWGGMDEQQFFLDYLDQIGIRRDSFISPGSAAFLYDLSDLNVKSK